jgi:FemAB-related protein (PEP-CTERM system-associated)
MKITQMRDQDRPAWDAFVQQSPDGMALHLSGFEDILKKTYGYQTHYLMAWDNERVVGVLPMFVVRSFLMGSSASTLPGGLCADSEEIAAALIAHGKELARQAKVKRFVLRDTRRAWDAGLDTCQQHVAFVVELHPDEEVLFNRIDRNLRRQVRMARKNGLEAVADFEGRLLDEFYDIFTHFTHQSGTPIFGLSFLQNIITTFPNQSYIVMVRQDHQPIGGYFQLGLDDTVYGLWGGALPEYLDLRPVHLAYWEIMRAAAAHGYRYLDMGRSPADSGAAMFKKQWGGQVGPVYQQIASLNGHPAGADVTSRAQEDETFKLFMQVWRRLPRPVVKFLGPKLRRHVPFA